MKPIVLLRGVNVGGRNRVAMPALREALEEAGMQDVVTYVQSGNVVLSSNAKPDALARECEAVIAERFELSVAVVVRPESRSGSTSMISPNRCECMANIAPNR